jgi:hypothetical protein
MADYKEESITGNSWQRCHTVTVNNQYGKTPSAIFQEEKIMDIGGQFIRQWTGQCEKVFNSTDTFPIINPTDNAPTGQVMSHAEFYAILYSLYMQTALERDAAQAATP